MVLLLFLIGERLEALPHQEQEVCSLPNGPRPWECDQNYTTATPEVEVSDLVPGIVIEVAAGSRLPADGRVDHRFRKFDRN